MNRLLREVRYPAEIFQSDAVRYALRHQRDRFAETHLRRTITDLRVRKGGRMGTAAFEGPLPADAWERAVRCADRGEDALDFAGPSHVTQIGGIDEDALWTWRGAEALMAEMREAILSGGLLCDHVSWTCERETIRIENTVGFSGHYRHTLACLQYALTSPHGNVGWLEPRFTRTVPEPNAVMEDLRQTIDFFADTEVSCADGEMDVCLSGSAARFFLSQLAERVPDVGSAVCTVDFSLTDDGRKEGGVASRPFDDRGFPTRTMILVQNGRVVARSRHGTGHDRRAEDGTIERRYHDLHLACGDSRHDPFSGLHLSYLEPSQEVGFLGHGRLWSRGEPGPAVFRAVVHGTWDQFVSAWVGMDDRSLTELPVFRFQNIPVSQLSV